jgi:cytochrome c-type biogenesis protein CcmF
VAALGTFLLLATFVAASGAFAASLAGARRRQASLIQGGIGLFHASTAMMLVASAVMIHSFVTGNFAIKYVQHYSNAAQPLFYKLASYWGGLDGSIMFWVTLLSAFGSVAVFVNRQRHRLLIPWVVATIAVVEMFFLFLMVSHNNPFETFLLTPPAEGRGLNPLLQNYYMAIHPPMLYLGFVGMTIPFAFGIAALASGQLDDGWLRAVRRWTMVAWLFRSIGLTLGALWAYEELGWGGYWGWDPVENAGLLPWFTATAFLHSVMVQERRGMLKIWNVSLVIVTFFLTIFGTFMTRSGVVQSVHSFGEDKQLAWMFTGFMVLTLVVSFSLVIYRMPLLRSRNELDSWVSREAAFLVNNWVLLFAAFFVLFATMFPTLSEAIRGERLTVGPPVFDKWLAPVGLVLLFLTGVGPLLAWRKSTIANLRQSFLWPVVGAVAAGGASVARGLGFWPTGLCFALCAFVATTIAQEFVRGASVRQRATGTDIFTALVGLFTRSRRRYGGYIVHVGIVLIFVGFAGNGFDREITLEMHPNDRVALSPYDIVYHGLSVTQDAQKQMITADMEAFKGNRSLGHMYPARWFWTGSDMTTEVALRRSPADDLYLVLAGFDAGTRSATMHMKVNPLVNWIWLGVGIMVIGTGIAFLPERAIAFATRTVPSDAVTTTLLIGVLALGAGRVVRAQSDDAAPQPLKQTSALGRQLEGDLMCLCGCGAQLGTCPMAPNCSHWDEEQTFLTESLNKGMTHDQVIDAFVKRYGSQQVLAAPIDKGFNRLLWILPYGVGLVGVVTVGGVALKWARRRDAEDASRHAAPAIPANPVLEERLDDELRELD